MKDRETWKRARRDDAMKRWGLLEGAVTQTAVSTNTGGFYGYAVMPDGTHLSIAAGPLDWNRVFSDLWR